MQIENSPSIETHKPVSRQYEIDYYRYYGRPAYWNGGAMWGLGGYPLLLPPSRDKRESPSHGHHQDDKHLQSTLAVVGYPIQTVDGATGAVSGFMVDDQSLTICDVVVETGHWYSGREILISPAKIERISHEKSIVVVNLTKAEIRRTAAHEPARAGH